MPVSLKQNFELTLVDDVNQGHLLYFKRVKVFNEKQNYWVIRRVVNQLHENGQIIYCIQNEPLDGI